jgi:hypothetical protein
MKTVIFLMLISTVTVLAQNRKPMVPVKETVPNAARLTPAEVDSILEFKRVVYMKGKMGA